MTAHLLDLVKPAYELFFSTKHPTTRNLCECMSFWWQAGSCITFGRKTRPGTSGFSLLMNHDRPGNPQCCRSSESQVLGGQLNGQSIYAARPRAVRRWKDLFISRPTGLEDSLLRSRDQANWHDNFLFRFFCLSPYMHQIRYACFRMGSCLQSNHKY